MNELVDALAPAMVVSVALQQLIELVDPVLDKFLQPHKKWILSAVAVVIGITLAAALRLRILQPLGVSCPDFLDLILTAFFLSGGTKAFNDLIKMVGYKKEETKAALDSPQIERV
ncbi:MAG: hypothetical protein JXA25_18895 [Anaerolineales bacterium]|nr:hypothetical protein [Anaerolineales bacterium]